MSTRIESFRDLNVYKIAFQLQQDIFEKSKSFPAEERYSLTDQMRRSSRAIGANIAEAWQKRRYPAHFVSKLSDADGEQAETLHWLQTAAVCRYFSLHESEIFMQSCHKIGAMLGKMMSFPEKFCQRFPDL
ncbi:MAG: four helix bundle protein [Kiritimatiellia bacterium]